MQDGYFYMGRKGVGVMKDTSNYALGVCNLLGIKRTSKRMTLSRKELKSVYLALLRVANSLLNATVKMKEAPAIWTPSNPSTT